MTPILEHTPHTIPFWLLKAIKIGVGSSLAVALCALFGLQYASFAGIVALLTIRNTKRDTFALAGKRMISFLFTVAVIALLLQGLQGENLVFAVFMLILAVASCAVGWEDTLSVNAVLGGHLLLTEQALTRDFLVNEFALLSVGIIIAILFNWYMPSKLAEIQTDIQYIERQLHYILHALSVELQQGQPVAKEPVKMRALKVHIEQAREKALDNMNNTLTTTAHAHSKYYVTYLNMRHNQCTLLLQCHQALSGVALDAPEIQELAMIIEEIGQAVHHKVGIRVMIAELETVVNHMKTETLPKTAMEFSEAVQLFYLLELLEEILREKRAFLLTLTEHEKEIYWKDA